MAVSTIKTTQMTWGFLNSRLNREPIDSSSLNNSYTDLLWELNQASSTYEIGKPNTGGSSNFYVGLITSVPYVNKGNGKDEDLNMKGPWYVTYCGTDENEGTGKYAFTGHIDDKVQAANTYYADRIVLKRELDYALEKNTVSPLLIGTYYTGVGIWYDSLLKAKEYLDKGKELPDGTYFPTTSYAEIFNDYENNIATGNYSHAEGSTTYAAGNCSHTEGYMTIAIGDYSHAEGISTKVTGMHSHVEGGSNYIIDGCYSHVEGYGNISYDAYIGHLEGYKNIAYGYCNHVEGYGNTTYGYCNHINGYENINYGSYSSISGAYNISYAKYAFVSGTYNHLDNENTNHLYVFGNDNKISNVSYSTIFGIENEIDTYLSKDAEYYPIIGVCNFIEGGSNKVLSSLDGCNHIEGTNNICYNVGASHIEGNENTCYATFSHVEGTNNICYGLISHISGIGNITYNPFEFALGQYNNAIKDDDNYDNGTIFTIGNGTTSLHKYSPHNIVAIYKKGDIYFDGRTTYIHTTDITEINSPSVSIGHITQDTSIANKHNIGLGTGIRISSENNVTLGKYNEVVSSYFVVGIGTSNNNRKNAFWISQGNTEGNNGVAYFSNNVYTYANNHDPGIYPTKKDEKEWSNVVTYAMYRNSYSYLYNTVNDKFNTFGNDTYFTKSIDSITNTPLSNTVHYTSQKFDNNTNKWITDQKTFEISNAEAGALENDDSGSAGLMTARDKARLDSIWEGDKQIANLAVSTGVWTIYKNDGITSYNIANIKHSTSSLTNASVEYGFKVKWKGKWKWTVNNQKNAERCTGTWGETLPKVNEESDFWESNMLFSEGSGIANQTIYAAKRGLIISGYPDNYASSSNGTKHLGSIVPATGEDNRSLSVSWNTYRLLFYGKLSLGDVESLKPNNFIDKNPTKITGRSWNIQYVADSSTCFFMAYPEKYGNISLIKKNGVEVITTSFRKIGTFDYVNGAGYSQKYNVYASGVGTANMSISIS